MNIRYPIYEGVYRILTLNATRSDNNPHGFIMEAFTITENKDLQTLKR